MNKRDLLASLLPPVAYSPDEPSLNAELTAEGNTFTRSEYFARQALEGITPIFAQDLLTDWERVLGLTSPSDAGYLQRQQRVLSKLAETGGLSIPYFIRLAANLGYSISITEPQPFRTGTNRIGDILWSEEIIWVWFVNISVSRDVIYRFRVGSSAVGERLLSFGDPVIESIFNDLKPAHTFCWFTYQELI